MVLRTQLLLPVALGFSIVTVTAFVVYYVFKKEDDNKDKSIRTTRVNVIEVEVPKSIVPALIGRNGSNIKKIEQKSGALIHFKKFSDKENDVCIIRGQNNTTQVAETLVYDFIKQQPVIVEDFMQIPAWSCGRVIGVGGESITEISHRSGARVKLEGQKGGDPNVQRQVTLRGTVEQIAVAKKLIENCVDQEKCRREIDQSKRSPRHAAASPSPEPPADTGDPPPALAKHVKCKAAEVNGSSIEVYVSAVSSPSRFWVQFVGPQVPQLDELVSHMTEYYSNRDNRAAHTLEHVAIGQVVAAVFRHDGRWYRARVHDIRPNEFDATQQVADVFYLDYGDSEYVATHELCELRADLLRLRFQAMECFLAGVRPVAEEADPATPAASLAWPKWHPQAVERFEELTQVARWKPLISRTCTYKKTSSGETDKETEIPGIKLYEATAEGPVDIGATLVAEGWAKESAAPPPAHPHTPFGDLTVSRVLGMLDPSSNRASSMPKDQSPTADKENIEFSSKSLSSGLEGLKEADKIKSISNLDLSYPDSSKLKVDVNGSHDFIASERQHDNEDHTPGTTVHPKTPLDEIKANINRIDSHHSSLEALGRQHELH